MLDYERRILFEGEYGVGRHGRVAGDVGTALAQFERLRGSVGNNGETHTDKMRNFTPVRVVALQDYFSVRLCADEFERPRSDGLTRDLVERAVGHDSNRSLREVPQKAGPWLFQTEQYRQFIWCFDAIHEAERGGLGAANLALE